MLSCIFAITERGRGCAEQTRTVQYKKGRLTNTTDALWELCDEPKLLVQYNDC